MCVCLRGTVVVLCIVWLSDKCDQLALSRDCAASLPFGDSPAVIKALSHDAKLAGHVIHQADEDVIGVTMNQVVCNEEQVRKHPSLPGGPLIPFSSPPTLLRSLCPPHGFKKSVKKGYANIIL